MWVWTVNGRYDVKLPVGRAMPGARMTFGVEG